MGLRAYWQTYNQHGELDRIEIEDTQWSDPAFRLKGDDTGFEFSHPEITSETNEGLLNVHANKIQIGRIDFRPRIESDKGIQLLTDIKNSSSRRFKMTWKIDGDIEWVGFITTRKFQYPEKKNDFFAKVRATDFELLKGVDYPLTDKRQTFIQTFADIFNILGLSRPIKTATSFVEKNVTDRKGSEVYDFLGEIRHQTKALRELAGSGDETDRNYKCLKALKKLAEPALLIKQIGGHIQIDQLSELEDPTSVNETIYNPDGSVKTATQNVDRRQTIYTKPADGFPVFKITSENTPYPGIKQAKVEYKHRTAVSNIQFPSLFTLDNGDSTTYPQSFSQLFLSDGSQSISISGNVNAFFGSGYDDVNAYIVISIDTGTTVYYWDDDQNNPGWVTSFNAIPIKCSDRGRSSPKGQLHRGNISIFTNPTPTDADGVLKVEYRRAESASAGYADYTDYLDAAFGIANQDAAVNSTSISYTLTQSDVDFPEVFDYGITIFGDGPNFNTIGALRHGDGDADTTSESWRRRGQTIPYRNYHENVLKEIIDLQRFDTEKKRADAWGKYDPSKVSDYNGSYFYYAGGKYRSKVGKWNPVLMDLSINTDTNDEFDNLLNFKEGGSSSSKSGTAAESGITKSDGDARWVNVSGDKMTGKLENTHNIIAFIDGGGAETSQGTYGVEVLNVSGANAQINYESQPLFDADGTINDAFIDGGTASEVSWGNITGTLSDQTDLQNALNGKLESVSESDVTQHAGALTWTNLGIAKGDVSASDVGLGEVVNYNIFPNGGYQALGTGDDVEFGITVVGNNVSNSFDILRFRRVDADEVNIRHGGSTWGVWDDINNRYVARKRGDDWVTSEGAGALLVGVISQSGSEKLRVNGKTLLEDTLTGVDATLSSTLDVGGATTITNTLDVTDDTVLGGALTVDLDTQFGDIIQSDHFSSGSTGWQMGYAGDLETNTVESRGNVTAYADGSGAETSEGTYAATVLNLNDDSSGTPIAQINRNGTSLFESDGTINDVFIDGGTASSVAWGNITGTLSDQTDLWNELAGKLESVSKSDVTQHSYNHSDLSLTMALSNYSNDAGFITGYSVTKADVTQYSYSYSDLGLTQYPVDSVNGETGAVSLSASDVGAVPASGGTFSGRIYAPLEHSSHYFNLKPFSSSYGDGSFMQTYYNGNSRKFIVRARYNNADAPINIELEEGGDFVTGNNTVWHEGNLNVTASYLESINQNLGTTDSPTFAGATFTGLTTHQGGIELQAEMNIKNNFALHFEDATASNYGGKVWFDDAAGSSGTLKIDAFSNGTLINAINIERDTGLVGIQKDNPSEALDVNGNINVSGVSYASDHTESDSRIKSNIRDADPLQVARLAELKTFDHRDKERNQIGLIADHFDDAHPSFIHWKKDDEFDKIRTLNTYALASTALAGVGELDRNQQTQTDLIAQLRNRVATLEQENEQLKKKVA